MPAALAAHLSLQQIFGWVFAPVAWSMGVPWRDAPTIGNLLGTRMALNEFVAYSQLGPLKASLDPKSFTIATFALCGFANFSSIGIQIGGIGALAPEPPPRSRAARSARDVRRDARELHDRHHRGLPSVMDLLRSRSRRPPTRFAAKSATVPTIAIVLGSGLGDFANALAGRGARCRTTICRTGRRRSVIGHEGRLVVGTAKGRAIAALAGRSHLYEGHDPRRSPSPCACMGLLGVKTLDPDQRGRRRQTRAFKAGALMVIDDHINLMGAQSAGRPRTTNGSARGFPT